MAKVTISTTRHRTVVEVNGKKIDDVHDFTIMHTPGQTPFVLLKISAVQGLQVEIEDADVTEERVES